MKVLGISFETHDNGVAFVNDGDIIFAINEERLSREKSDNSFPELSLKECLSASNLYPCEIDFVAISGFPRFKNLFFYANDILALIRLTRGKSFFSFQFAERNIRKTKTKLEAIAINIAFSTGIPQYLLLFHKRFARLKKLLPGFKGEIRFVDHHIGHLAGAYYTSEWEDSLGVVAEGSGWDYTFSITDITKGNFKRLHSVCWPHSPGRFYRLITEILGFDPRIHGGKITGLAAYGDYSKAASKVNNLIKVENGTLIVSPLIYTLLTDYHLNSNKIPKYFEEYNKEDLAASFQKRLEDCICELIMNYLTSNKRIVFSGGVAANVKLNQKINEIPKVDGLYVFPAMSDAGLALGSALWVTALEFKKIGKVLKPKPWENVFLGLEFKSNDIESELKKNNCKYEKVNNIEFKTAEILSMGHLVARFNGRMEYGPRALGNRSVLYNAQDKSVNDWLNVRLDRTEFMPFAPITIDNEVNKCYENIKDNYHTSKFMTLCYECTDYMKNNYPAAVHVDNTARPQFINARNDISLYNIIKEYQSLTGFGTLINTSFNMHEEPIVCTPFDAINAFKKGNLDYLAIGDFIVSNNSGERG